MPLPPLHQTSLIKVWGSPGHGRPDTCVISAHGSATGTSFNLPHGVTLQYYSAHGQPALLGPQNADLLRIASGQYQPANPLPAPETGNNRDNYALSKFEDYHEGYGGTAGKMFEAVVLKPLSAVQANPDRGTYDQIKGAVRTGVLPEIALLNTPRSELTMNVVTIRFRVHQSDPNLDAVVLQLVGLGYKNIHCPFCRG
ncbi:MAG: hypothetical protein JO097_16390 [Acidobacteriaceae bacterium]|nr:hypothetical protein [Acidobacteriaceae bacterium]MBV9767687.1 hypothetical protein [Acidobacteriaceae bacterium]